MSQNVQVEQISEQMNVQVLNDRYEPRTITNNKTFAEWMHEHEKKRITQKRF